MTTDTATKTTISYYLNGEHLDGWDENDHDTIDIEAAAQNLTDYRPGDVLTARLWTVDDWHHTVVLDEQSITL